MAHFVDVLLPIPLSKTFTYAITSAEANFIRKGMRISVPFGKRKIYAGLAVRVHQDAPVIYEAKEIDHIIDETPIVLEKQFELWQWIASYYMCPEGAVMKAAMPGAFLLESETRIHLNRTQDIDLDTLEDSEYLLYEALRQQSSMKIDEASQVINKKNVFPVINVLLQRNAIEVEEEVVEKYRPKYEKYIRIDSSTTEDRALEGILDELSRAKKQKEALLHLFTLKGQGVHTLPLKKFKEDKNVSGASIKGLLEKKYVNVYEEQVSRMRLPEHIRNESIPILSVAQQKALDQIQTIFSSKSTCLFHGVTASGKTAVHVHLISQYLKQGAQVVYLLPEIALTTHVVLRLQHYFEGQIVVYHSRYSVHERVEMWQNVLQNKSEARLIVGARSTIFLPFSKLGLIIVDEEHENSYKQFEPAPHYHTRDTALVLSKLHNAKTILSSATPSLESYTNAKENKYGLVELTERYTKVPMPEIELVDLKEAYRKKRMKGHFSDRLIELIEETLAVEEQVILFQNRRGYSPVVECMACGHVPQCPNCDVSLTYHEHRKQLRCHYCGYQIAMMNDCMACDSIALSTKGFGTEQIEMEAKTLFPEHSVARMDQDTTRGKYALEKLLTAFENKEVDILIGTQMLAKGLDFQYSTAVGVLHADGLLHFPDFRAHERCFQLLQQVSGRAGRAEKRGKVVIQTYNPYHQILQQVTTYDYQSMYADEMEERRQYVYPPFCRIIQFTFKGKDFTLVNEAAEWYATSLRSVFQSQVLGPEFPAVSRIRNQYIKNVLLKIPTQQSLQKTKNVIQKISKTYTAIAAYKSVRAIVNVDP